MAKTLSIGVLLIVVHILWIQDASAQSCSMLSHDVDDARTKLRRAVNETNLEDAKDYARRAKSSLENASMAAMDCGCNLGSMDLDVAASGARNARDADSSEEFVSYINRAIRAFNSSLQALRARPRKRQ
jgi:ubiquitin